MKKGCIKISINLIEQSLQLPINWHIESMEMEQGERIVKTVISGEDFPEVEDGIIQPCNIIVHKEQIQFEVQPL